MSNKILFRATSRGFADHDWLKTHHTFSFAGYHNAERMNFGALRVFNDDLVKGGRGFGAHPHQNMEIVTIPLQGALQHEDSLGSHGVIHTGDIQIMSAGTGVTHSEYNASLTDDVAFLQIWLFTDQQNVSPRYDQMRFEQKENAFVPLIAAEKTPNTLQLHQKAWFSMGYASKNNLLEYTKQREESGLFVFVIKGALQIDDELLSARDAIGLTALNQEQIRMEATEDAQFLVIEVPMQG